jgi:hypothetical protein
MTIVLRSVQSSSAIAATGYNREKKVLAVQFKSGQTYHYFGVEQMTFDKLMKSDSMGRFLQVNVVGKYKQEKQDEGKEARHKKA